jgi:hypothetical protein
MTHPAANNHHYEYLLHSLHQWIDVPASLYNQKPIQILNFFLGTLKASVQKIKHSTIKFQT